MRIDAEDTFFFITLFYIIVAIVAMTLSFFLILVSFVSNVKDNSWEFGVLRAVGLNKVTISSNFSNKLPESTYMKLFPSSLPQDC